MKPNFSSAIACPFYQVKGLRRTVTRIAGKLAELYKDYYATDRDTLKRGLSARDTVRHIRSLSQEPLGRMLDVGAGNGSVLLEVD